MSESEKEFKAKLVTFDEAYATGLELADKIKSASIEFDAVVAIARGGFPPGRFICDFLNIEVLSSLQIKYYGGGAEKQESAKLLDPAPENLKGKKVLLVDDVNSSGETLKAAVDHLNELQPEVLKTAVLHEKESSDFRADFYGRKLEEWRWLIYQWAAAEDVLEFLEKGDMSEAGVEEAQQFLKEEYALEIETGLMERLMDLRKNYL